MTPFESWKRKFDRYRNFSVCVADTLKNNPNVKTILSADVDDKGNCYNFTLDDSDDAFAAALQDELQRAVDAETLLSMEELGQTEAYKLSPDDLD